MRVEVREEMRGGTGVVSIQHHFEKEEMTAKCRLCAKLVLPPGVSIGEHGHEAEDEVYIITRGQGVLDDGESESVVTAGDAILTGNGGCHAIRNDGTEDLEMTAVIMSYA